jgi:hypothetical protein
MALNRTRTHNTDQAKSAEATSPVTTGKEIVPALRAAGLQAIELPGGRDNVKRYLVTGTAEQIDQWVEAYTDRDTKPRRSKPTSTGYSKPSRGGMLPEMTVIVSLRPRHRFSAEDRDAYRNGAIALTGLIGGFLLLAYWLLPVAFEHWILTLIAVLATFAIAAVIAACRSGGGQQGGGNKNYYFS